jgi:signal transduction histidine kinase
MWHLNLYPSAALPEKLSTGNLLSLTSGIIAAALALVALAIYFYRENSREMRTAAEQVTFVNQVSHELKTPLTNIRMYAELAEGKIPAGEDPHGARRCLDIVVNESQRLSRLIGNVLTFAKPKAQQANPTRNVPDELIRETLEHFRPALESQDFAISFEADAASPVLVDADILGQILGNLFSNVEKYAAAGKVLEITSKQDRDTTIINVTDRGPGVPRAQREKIFKPFNRLSNKLSDGVSGTGIGLTIARDLARKHGGDLTLSENRDTKGCRFALTLKTLTG